MSFNLGNTSGAGMGITSTPNKAGFGNFSFGAPTAAAPPTANTGFGGATSGFGAATSGFGTATGFGGFGTTTATTSAPAFGFGTQTTSAVPSFGGFGTAQPQQQQQSTLGATGGFSGFGATQQVQPAPAFGGLGTTPSTGFGGGGGGFGTGFGGFNATATTTTASMFGKFGTTNTSNTNFSTGGVGGFGTLGTGLGLGFGQSQQQQQPFMQQQQQQLQQAPLSADEALAQAIFNVAIFGDERDTVMAKWNYLQAMWGTGKLFYSQSCQPLEIAPTNYLCRFKTIGYNKIPGKDNKLGFVSLIFDKPIEQVKEHEQRIIQQLNQFFGNKPTIIITIDSCKSQTATKTQLMFHVDEKSQISAETKRIPAMDVFNCLNQPMTKQNVMQMGVTNIVPLVHPDDDQLKEYLDNPPKGIDPRMWLQAKKDNPNPNKFIPVPIIGFNELQWRIKCQENETETHKQYLVKVQHDLAELKQRHATTTAKIMEHKRKFAELSHRILQIVVRQECTRKFSLALSPEEEILRNKMENMQALVSAPNQFKGRLSELLSQMRMQRYQWNNAHATEYTLDKDSSEEMKTFLTMQHKATAFLIETVNKDLRSLNIIINGMKQAGQD